MPVLSNEILLINNPALGAYLQWEYSLAYQENHKERDASPGILLFLVLPILFHGPSLEFLDRTRRSTGLAKYSDKFLDATNKKSDLLLSMHDRVLEMREISLYSLQLAIKQGLLTLVPRTGKVIPFDKKVVPVPPSLPSINLRMQRNAVKLGYWFSQNSLKDISFYLKVFF
jgi:hypothetical protein